MAAELLKTRKALKQKYHNLKSDIAKSQFLLEKNYKPITQPLNEIVSTLKVPPKLNLKEELKEESIRDSVKPRPSTQPPNDYYRLTTPIDLEEQTFQFDPIQNQPEITESFFDETFPSLAADNETEHQRYLNQFKIPLPRAYIEDRINDTKGDFDDTFGVYFDPFRKSYAIGDSSVDFDGADFIINGEFKYTGTPGLYELMFKKNPAGYRPTDLDQYIDIIKRTNAQFLSYNPERGLSTSNASKFIDIIKPRITNLYSMSQDRKRNTSIRTLEVEQRPRSRSIPEPLRKTRSQNKKGGKLTLMEFNNKNIEFKHFDDYNEIVDRLKLLIASQLAGNTGHNNEIVSIIEELKEGKIIR